MQYCLSRCEWAAYISTIVPVSLLKPVESTESPKVMTWTRLNSVLSLPETTNPTVTCVCCITNTPTLVIFIFSPHFRIILFISGTSKMNATNIRCVQVMTPYTVLSMCVWFKCPQVEITVIMCPCTLRCSWEVHCVLYLRIFHFLSLFVCVFRLSGFTRVPSAKPPCCRGDPRPELTVMSRLGDRNTSLSNEGAETIPKEIHPH